MGVAKQSTCSNKRKRADIRGYFGKESTSCTSLTKKGFVTTGALAKPDSPCPSTKKLKLVCHTESNTVPADTHPRKAVSTFGAWNVNSLCSRLRNDKWVESIRTFLTATKVECLFLSEVKLRAGGPHQWRPSNCADKKAAGEYQLIQKNLGKGGAFEVVSHALSKAYKHD